MAVSRRTVLSGFVGGAAALGAGLVVDGPDAVAVPPRGRVREYWLQVDHVRQDACPTKFDPMMGMPITENTVFDGLVYRAFSPNWESVLPGSATLGPNTGFPGPVIRGKVGDRIRVHLRNNDTFYNQPHSLHPHGVRYTPANCGSWTSVDTQPGSAVMPGDTYTYEWDVVEGSIGTWPYHDHSQPFEIPGSGGSSGSGSGMDMDDSGPTMELGAQLGLMGHIVIDDPELPRPDKEIFLVFHDLYADSIPTLDGDVDCFNGRAFLGNTPRFTAKVGERVRWHVIAMGTEFHVFHLHGHRWRTQYGGRRVDSEILGPSMSLVVDYVEDNPGRWLYHCHVVDHMVGGMVGEYLVTS